jgi:hypothetical protein
METKYNFKVCPYNRLTEEGADKFEMKFSSREEYLIWVNTWKEILKEKIQMIRDQKVIRRDKTQDTEVRNGANAERQSLRVVCFNLQMVRQAGKKKSIADKKALNLVSA